MRDRLFVLATVFFSFFKSVCAKRLLLFGLFTQMMILSFAQNLVANGDLEGSNLSSFRVNDYVNNVKRELQEPRIITDNQLNHHIVVTSNYAADNSYDSQLILSLDKPLENGTFIKLSMRIKADIVQQIRIQYQSTPGNYISIHDLNIPVSTEWTTYTKTLLVNKDDVQAIAFDLSNGKVNNFFFDDISVEISDLDRSAVPGFTSFKVIVPDKPIVQGDRIQIIYELTASNYSFKRFNGGIESGELVKTSNEKSNPGLGVARLSIKADVIVWGVGKLKVLPVTAIVSGIEISSDITYIDVLPNKEYASGWRTAYDFLVEKGVNTPNLIKRYSTETMIAFSDQINNSFVVVASDYYKDCMDNPILAYSIRESYWGSTSVDAENSIYIILAYYELQMKYLKRHNHVYEFQLESIFKPKSNKTGPLLGNIKYNQGYPYNKNYPYEMNDGRKSQYIAGCGPVAMAQILSYYHHPVTLKGKCAITTKSGKRYRKDLADYQVCWDGSDDDLANLTFSCAISISADMSVKATSSSIYNIKDALSKYWGYSRGCRLMEDYTDLSKLASIYFELEAGRPMIVTDNKHLWVCDGYENDYLHYNLGWGGSFNGYYRAMIVPSISGKQMTFKDILIGIEPRKK